MLGRAGLVPKLGPRPPETTHAVKWVTWYKMRPSDWSIQKMLQSDWLVRIPPPYTTNAENPGPVYVNELPLS